MKVELKEYLLPFIIAFGVALVIFLALDYAIMKLQGLSLIFSG